MTFCVRWTLHSFSLLFFSVLLWNSTVFANQTCSRLAIVDERNVLVDSSSLCKGEGLRPYLSKDPIALSYLDQYQEGLKTNWFRAGMSMFGSSLILAGILTGSPTKKGLANKDVLIYSGIGLLGLSYILTRTHQAQNEEYLNKSILEYNLRNWPKIEFSPLLEKSQSAYHLGLGIQLSQNF